MNLNTFELMKTLGADAGLKALDEEQVHALQRTVAGITDDIVSYCRRHDLHVYLCGGSAIGAIRHKGFIPWDDDMDLHMTRADHDAFVRGFLSEYGDKYWIHTPGNPAGYNSLMTKVVLKGTIVRQYEDRNNPECGAYVDIFVLENAYDQPFLFKMHGYQCMLMAGMLSCRRYAEEYKQLKAIVPAGSDLLKAVRFRAILGRLLMWRSLRKWTIATDKCFSRCKNTQSKNLVCPSGRKHYFGEEFVREKYVKTRLVPFEQYTWPISDDVESYLRQLYGDYMQIPPPEKRERHMLLELKL